jgi:monoamine oxidase
MLNPGSVLPRGDVDVAVIGAGAAGIAAGRRLAAAGVSFVVLEARSRAGGRAWTAAYSGHPLDLGCGWLHSADRNPWSRIAEQEGLTIDRTPAPWSSGDRDLVFSGREQADFEEASEAFYERIHAASAREKDVSAADLLEAGCRWNALLNAISSYANGAELDRISVHDSARYEDSEVNWRVREGYGTAIAVHGAGLPIALECPVTRVDHGGATIRIETARGEVSARAIIVTVPTAILASEAIKFVPAIAEKSAAAAGLPLGLADKVTLLFDRAEEVRPETRLFGAIDRARIGAYHFRPFGRPLVEGYFGGQLARDLEEAGEGAFAAYAIDEIVSQLGSGMRVRLKPLAATAWRRDRYAQGSYSYASPGKAAARAALALPVNERLFFAGEACSAASFSTAHGAYETGVRAADEAIAAVTRRSIHAG